MWVLNGFPREIPKNKDEPHDVEMELIRRECNNGATVGELAKIETHLKYINMILQKTVEMKVIDSCSATQLFICTLNVAYEYESLAQQIRERAYSDSRNGEWQSCSRYSMKGIGLLQYMEELQVLGTDEASKLRWWISLYQVSQQLGTIVLTISKMRTRLYADAEDRFSKMLSFQHSDLESLSKSSVLYARLAIGCSESCDRLLIEVDEIDNLSDQIINMKRFLDCLALTLLSLDKYQTNECGTAIAMLRMAVNTITPLLSNGQMDLVKDHTTFQILRGKTKLKSLNNKLRNKLSSNIGKNCAFVHPFILNIISDFLVPLIIILQARYKHANELFFTQSVEHCTWILPLGKSPEVKGTQYTFDGYSLVEQPESRLRY